MTTVLYRKYRPKDFSEVVGQEIIVKTLSRSLLDNHVAGSYLLTGPRGTGKTSLARIFATALNCQNRTTTESCGQCAHCRAVADNQSLDIIEIDAASYTGVDNIRSLRDTMANTPLLGKYKIFIIDEVHMLSSGAFNALLKIMEEPPAHVIFILATTELHKVPKTIVSRCQRFDLRKLSLEEIINKLEKISKAEKISCTRESLALIARASGGALRDAESLLTQLTTLTKGKLTTEAVQEALGLSDNSLLYALVQHFTQGDSSAVLKDIESLDQGGKEPTRVTQELIELLRNILLFSVTRKFQLSSLALLSPEEQQLIENLAAKFEFTSLYSLIEDLEESIQKFKNSTFGFLPLEIVLIKHLSPETTSERKDPPVPPSSDQRDSSEDTSSKKETLPKQSVAETKNPSTEITARDSHESLSLSQIKENWQDIVQAALRLNASLSVALQGAEPIQIQNNHLSLGVKYQFHKERLEEESHKLTLEEAFATILGTRILFSVVQSENKKVERNSSPEDPLISEALALLGGQVL